MRTATVALAHSYSPIVTSHTEWNADAWLLGVRGGAWDLRRGAQCGERELINKAVGGVPRYPKYKCPLWQQTLDESSKAMPEWLRSYSVLPVIALPGW
jgi:hypothetical protein